VEKTLKNARIWPFRDPTSTIILFFEPPVLFSHSLLRFPAQYPAVFNLYGSVLLASGLMAIPAFRPPLKFVPLLFIQLLYKPIWLAVVAIPLSSLFSKEDRI